MADAVENDRIKKVMFMLQALGCLSQFKTKTQRKNNNNNNSGLNHPIIIRSKLRKKHRSTHWHTAYTEHRKWKSNKKQM